MMSLGGFSEYQVVGVLPLLIFICIVKPQRKLKLYTNSSAYAFRNESSDKLIITIEGSGW
jgi:hypothetical protein